MHVIALVRERRTKEQPNSMLIIHHQHARPLFVSPFRLRIRRS